MPWLLPGELPRSWKLSRKSESAYEQGIAGLDCWIAQSGLQSKVKIGFGFSIQFYHESLNFFLEN
jgi:hypothetical protein